MHNLGLDSLCLCNSLNHAGSAVGNLWQDSEAFRHRKGGHVALPGSPGAPGHSATSFAFSAAPPSPQQYRPAQPRQAFEKIPSKPCPLLAVSPSWARLHMGTELQESSKRNYDPHSSRWPAIPGSGCTLQGSCQQSKASQCCCA